MFSGLFVILVCFYDILKDKTKGIPLLQKIRYRACSCGSQEVLVACKAPLPMSLSVSGAKSPGIEEVGAFFFWGGTFWEHRRTHGELAGRTIAPLPRPPTQGRTIQRPLLVSQFRPNTHHSPPPPFSSSTLLACCFSVSVLVRFTGPDGTVSPFDDVIKCRRSSADNSFSEEKTKPAVSLFSFF